jgi:hypothetical protein
LVLSMLSSQQVGRRVAAILLACVASVGVALVVFAWSQHGADAFVQHPPPRAVLEAYYFNSLWISLLVFHRIFLLLLPHPPPEIRRLDSSIFLSHFYPARPARTCADPFLYRSIGKDGDTFA